MLTPSSRGRRAACPDEASWRSRVAAVFFLLFAALGSPAADGPFDVVATLQNNGAQLRVSLTVPPKHFVYAESWTVSVERAELKASVIPPPIRHFDSFSEEEKDVYPESVEFLYDITAATDSWKAIIRYRGCDESVCFFPETREFDFGASAPLPAAPEENRDDRASSPPEQADWKKAAAALDVRDRAVGFLPPRDFLAFLDRAEGKTVADSGSGLGTRLKKAAERFAEDPVAFYSRVGIPLTVLLILAGGLLLNLTPCVLPMIPINLAIMGAGAQASSRARGMALGSVYGLAMAAVYGALGLVVVLTGSRFGALNGSPWFNLGLAVVFVFLALAMFDVISIDFTRFQGAVSGTRRGRKGGLALAFTMGAVSAMLAGACVAPVVIAVLVLSGNLYSNGITFGLLLPFLLGLGMALPWPLAGAGLSFLPKPGAWMVRVKQAFGVLLLLLAAYWGFLSHAGFTRSAAAHASEALSGVETIAVDGNRSVDGLAHALTLSVKDGKPVLIDFWATWCKNCLAMDKATFRDAAVLKRLSAYRVVKFQAERPNDPPASDVMEHFDARGLPTYVILVPRPTAAATEERSRAGLL